VRGLVERQRRQPSRVQSIDRAVVRDVQQPRAKRRLAAPAREPVVGAQERVLGDVLGVVVAGDARGDTQHDVAVALDQSLEGLEIAGERRAYECVVRCRHQIH
jgi:hypothetical protein